MIVVLLVESVEDIRLLIDELMMIVEEIWPLINEVALTVEVVVVIVGIDVVLLPSEVDDKEFDDGELKGELSFKHASGPVSCNV